MVLVSFLLIGAAFGFASRQVFVSEARESMMTNSREISRMAVAYAAEGDLRSLELRMTLSTIGASTNQHIFIVNPSGYIITCSDSAVFCEHIGKRLDESVSAILPSSASGITATRSRRKSSRAFLNSFTGWTRRAPPLAARGWALPSPGRSPSSTAARSPARAGTIPSRSPLRCP